MEKVGICPKCKGNVFTEWDQSDGGWYEYCLQCSYRHYLPVLVEKQKVAVRSIKKKQNRREK